MDKIKECAIIMSLYNIPTEQWEKVVDYYYEHVHPYDELKNYNIGDEISSLTTWLFKEYGAMMDDFPSGKIKFKNAPQKSLFILRWS